MTNEQIIDLDEEKPDVPELLPILPLRKIVVFPYMIIPLIISRPSSVQLINDVLLENRLIGLFAQKDPEIENPTEEDIYHTGTMGSVLKMMKSGEDQLRILVQGINRVKLDRVVQSEPYYVGDVSTLEDIEVESVEVEALMKAIVNQFKELVELTPHLPDEAYIAALNIDEPDKLADFIASNIQIDLEERQKILETLDVKERLDLINSHIFKEVELLRLSSKIQSEAKGEMEKAQREFFLRQQLKAIQKELGISEGVTAEIEDLREKIEEKLLPEEAEKKALDELDRLSRMNPASAEYSVARTYIDWILILPWLEGSEEILEIDEARKILDEDHYDLDLAKERILEFLAVHKLKDELRGPILSFIGPPGTGKTSIGKSIARAMGREFVRMSLGGIHDEAEIRGHRRTYVGALPGRIIQGIREAGTNNPVFMLDEIDKVGKDFRGDPSSALLEVLDPEQNFAFRDNYLDLPFDLSKVMFITTGNVLHTIPPALKDRMEILRFPGYSTQEKIQISRKFLIPKNLDFHGLKKKQMKISNAALKKMITDYTKEAGLRNLERMIARICRKTAVEVVRDKKHKTNVKKDNLVDYLGPEKFFDEVKALENQVGLATGVAYSETGGTIIFVEAIKMRGEGELKLTGQLGDVMQESAHAALSYIRACAKQYGIPDEDFEKFDFHIHVPAGATPKDGPSAGITMATALASVLTNRPVNKDIAMTGEITLRGKVMPIGGVREKALAAKTAGITRVILPAENKNDVSLIQEEHAEGIEFIFVKTVDEVLDIVLLDEN